MNWFLKNKILPSITKEIKAEYLENISSKNSNICNAPFTSLYFTANGLIKPCCAHSDLISFGKYPKTSIADALVSKNRKILQQHMKSDNLSFGCKLCLKHITNGNYKGSISSLYYKYSKNKYPEIIDFELSYLCNLDCVMCYLHKSKDVNKEIYGKPFLEEIKPYLHHIKASRFYGGEPFIIKIYREIWDYLIMYNNECQVHIQTNGTIFNSETENLLKNLNTFIGVSIDAVSSNLYEKIRKGASYKIMMENTHKFNEIMLSQGKALSISFCPMPINYHEIKNMMPFVDSMKSMIFFNTVNYPPQYSFDYLPSIELEKIVIELGKIKPEITNNPHQSENFRKLHHLIQGLKKLSLMNQKYEKHYSTISLKVFLLKLNETIEDDAIILKLKDLMTSFDMNATISPYLQAYVAQLSKNEIKLLITNIINEKDVNALKTIFQLNNVS